METPTSSFDLVERVKGGDQEAFTRLFEKYQRRLAVLIHYQLSPEMRGWTEVDDILQETLLRAYRDIGRFTWRTPGSFLSWLFSIARHVIVDTVRHQGREKRHPEELVRFRSPSNPGGPEPADSRTPSRLLSQQEEMDALLAKLNALPDNYRHVLLMAKMEGLTTTEMAERLGKPREAVALLLYRAVQRFRVLLESKT